jgi:hypothetical protein
MQKMFSNYTVTLPELQGLPSDLMKMVQDKPVAVLDRNQTLFYVVGQDLLSSLLDGGAASSGAPGIWQEERRRYSVADAPTPLFAEVARKLLSLEAERARRGMFSPESVQIMRNRLDANLLPIFGHLPVGDIEAEHIDAFLERMGELEASSITISQYLVILRKVLKLAISRKWLKEMPEIPKIAINNQPRSTFSVAQYGKMLRTAKRLTRERAEAPDVKQGGGTRERFWITAKYRTLLPDMYWLIGFMTNSFVRPSDIKWIQHKHVEIVRGERVYLRLNLPTTKKHDKPIVTLRPAVRIYEMMLAHAKATGHGGPEDYLFMPAESDREHALAILNFWLKWVLREAGIPLTDTHGKTRTLYCLRHTAITFRLLFGQGIDMLTLARNARTSVDMIENFYASTLQGEMNVSMLQSRRAQR